jgi:hypothetical protein
MEGPLKFFTFGILAGIKFSLLKESIAYPETEYSGFALVTV